jgi:hypothetical protein
MQLKALLMNSLCSATDETKRELKGSVDIGAGTYVEAGPGPELIQG